MSANDKHKRYFEMGWLYNSSIKAQLVAHWRPWVDYINGILPGCKDVLDVGGGPYGLGSFLGRPVCVVDPLADWLATNFDTSPMVSFKPGHAAALPFQDQSIDLVICTTTLEHVVSIETALSEISRVLRPGGRLLWSENTASGFWLWLKKLHYWLGWQNPTKLHLLTASDMVAVLRRSGFSIMWCREAVIDSIVATRTRGGFIEKVRRIAVDDGWKQGLQYAAAVLSGGRRYTGDTLIMACKQVEV